MNDDDMTSKKNTVFMRQGDSKFIKAAVSVVLMIPAGMFLLSLWLTRRNRSVSKSADVLSYFDQKKE